MIEGECGEKREEEKRVGRRGDSGRTYGCRPLSARESGSDCGSRRARRDWSIEPVAAHTKPERAAEFSGCESFSLAGRHGPPSRRTAQYASTPYCLCLTLSPRNMHELAQSLSLLFVCSFPSLPCDEIQAHRACVVEEVRPAATTTGRPSPQPLTNSPAPRQT